MLVHKQQTITKITCILSFLSTQKQPQFFLKSKNLNKLVGFEFWEILTMLTVALSFASAIMWYSNFQPIQASAGLSMIEKQKHIIYNNLIENTTQAGKHSTALAVKKDCSADNSEVFLNTLELDEQLSKIKISEESIKKLKSEVESSINPIIDQNKILKLSSDYENYISNLKMFKEDQYQFKKYKYETRILTHEICSKNFELQESYSAKLLKLENQMKKIDSKNINNLKNLITKFAKEYNKSEEDVDKIENLIKIYDEIFEISYDNLLSNSNLIDAEKRTMEQIKVIDDDERFLAKRNPSLELKVVYIF